MTGDARLAAADVSVGDTGPEFVVEDVERSDFVRYAGASGDFNPLHYDEPYARSAGNESVFAQGMLTAGYVSSMAIEWFGLASLRDFSTRFQDRVWPGETITVTGKIVEKTPTADGAEVVAKLRAETRDGDVVITGSATAVLPDA